MDLNIETINDLQKHLLISAHDSAVASRTKGANDKGVFCLWTNIPLPLIKEPLWKDSRIPHNAQMERFTAAIAAVGYDFGHNLSSQTRISAFTKNVSWGHIRTANGVLKR